MFVKIIVMSALIACMSIAPLQLVSICWGGFIDCDICCQSHNQAPGCGGGPGKPVVYIGPTAEEIARNNAVALQAEGLKLFDQGEYETALSKLEETRKIWPQTPDIDRDIKRVRAAIREREKARKRDKYKKIRNDTLRKLKDADGTILWPNTGVRNPAAADLKDAVDPNVKTGTVSIRKQDKGRREQRPSVIVNEPTKERVQQDIQQARSRIPELQREIKGLQTLLRQFSASMRGNVAEFEKWQETFNAAAVNSEKTAIEYAASMFVQYNLLGSLERSVQKNAFVDLDKLINSSDPKMRLWLGKQLKNRHLEFESVQKMVEVGKLSGDFAELLAKDPDDFGKNLCVLLVVNDLLEVTKVLPWKASAHFEQAKAIGETIANLGAYGYSYDNVRTTAKATDAYNREISHLSTKLKQATKEIQCLDRCLDAYTNRCVDRCAGKTRFGSPPPLPR